MISKNYVTVNKRDELTLNARAGSAAKKREAETKAVMHTFDMDSAKLMGESSVILYWVRTFSCNYSFHGC